MRHQIPFHISILAAAIMLLASAPAIAAPGCGSNTVPSDDSQVSQYTETVPGACGEEQTGGGGSSGGGGGGGSESGGSGTDAGSTGSVVPTDSSQSDASIGTDGTGGSTSSSGQGDASSAGQGQSNGSAAGQPNELENTAGGQSDPSTVSGLSNTSSDDDGGLGWVLPVVLGLTLVGAIAYAVRRRLRSDGGISSPSGA